jgi:mono/diheme cytochrome c family protein
MVSTGMIRSILGIVLTVGAGAQTPTADYQRDIHPLFARKCFACHGGDKRSGGLSLRDYASTLEGGRSGALLVPGDPAESLLLRRVTGEVQPQMPPGGKLTETEMAALRSWIREGARPAPAAAPARRRFVPPLSLQTPELPAPLWPGWDRPADRILAAYFNQHGLAQPKPVPDPVFARRVYLDLWGLLPSPEQLNEFLTDRSADKRARLVRTLLAHRRNFAGHWVNFWNDLLHNDDAMFHGGERRPITSWLTPALEQNMPYDQFLSRLLNPVAPGDPHGFLLGVNWRGEVSASQTPHMQAAQNAAQVFLGVNLKCNACHDSFVSRWKLKDAFALAAYFAPESKLEMVRCDNPTGQFADPGFLYPVLDRPAGATPAERRATISAIFTDPRNGRVPRTLVNRIWQRLMGRGLVEPVDDMDAEPWSIALLDWLSADFVASGYDMNRLLETILTSRAYELPSVAQAPDPRNFVFRGPQVRRLTAEQFVDSISALTGEWRTFLAPRATQAVFARDYQLKVSPLTLALGRPTREQVATERPAEATTLQALELVNGRDLFRLVSHGAQRLRGERTPAPVPLWDSGPVGSGSVKNPPTVDLDVSQRDEIYLVVADQGSYDPEQTRPLWLNANFDGQPVEAGGRGASYTVRLDLRGKNYRRFRATATHPPETLRSDINPSVRFFVFAEKPDPERLVPVAPDTPVPTPAGPFAGGALIDRVYRHAYGRKPTAAEAAIAARAAASTPGLADLLWAIALSPEFQLIL